MTARLALIITLLWIGVGSAPARGGVPASQLRSYQDKSTLELTTTGRKSGEARTVTIWFVADAQGCLYVQSGKDGETDWYRNLIKTTAVTMRIGELSMTGVAVPVEDLTEIARVHELFRQKYLRARVAEWVGSEAGRGKVVQLNELTQLP